MTGTFICFKRLLFVLRFCRCLIFLERLGPVSVKYVLKCFGMTSVSVTIMLFVMTFLWEEFPDAFCYSYGIFDNISSSF